MVLHRNFFGKLLGAGGLPHRKIFRRRSSVEEICSEGGAVQTLISLVVLEVAFLEGLQLIFGVGLNLLL